MDDQVREQVLAASRARSDEAKAARAIERLPRQVEAAVAARQQMAADTQINQPSS